jgi:iron complex transport system substrate-binding protein
MATSPIRRRWSWAAIIVAVAMVAAACGAATPSPTASPAGATPPPSAAVSPTPAPTPTATPSPSPADFPLSIQETDGQTLTLTAPPQRIVSLSAHFTQILCDIGAGDQLVAVELYANCPPGTKTKPALDAYQPSLEKIAAYRPDLVYVFSDTGGIVAALRSAGIPVLYLALPDSLDGIYDQIALFGRLTGHDDQAAQVIATMKARIDAIEAKLSDLTQGPRVFHELDPTLYTAAPQSFVGSLYTLLKAQNIAAGAKEAYPQLSAEVVIQRNPQVIVLADEAAGVTPAAVKKRPGWSRISAVKENRICTVDPDLVSQPAPKIVDGLAALAHCLYPDRFP